MKKGVLIISLFTLVFTLSGCKVDDIEEPTCTEKQILVNGVCEDIDRYLLADSEATFNHYLSSLDEFTPYNGLDINQLKILELVSDTLYKADYDWNLAISEGLATYVGDFETSGASSLPYILEGSMALGDPIDVNGDGLVWRITLRDDLTFEDGTSINVSTFKDVYKMILDASNEYDSANYLIDEDYLPLVNASDYYNQSYPSTDNLGFSIYKVGDVIYKREYALDGHFDDHEDWPAYTIEPNSPWSSEHLIGPNNEVAKLEKWNYSYTQLNSFNIYTTTESDWFIETPSAEPFKVNSNGELLAPEEGWALDGVPLSVATEDDTLYASAYPAYMDSEGNFATLDENGLPLNGELFTSDPISFENVGFHIINDTTFELSLTTSKTVFDVKEILSMYELSISKVSQLEANSMYSKNNIPLAYGPYKITSWTDTEIQLKLNNYFNAGEYQISKIKYDITDDTSVWNTLFKADKLDLININNINYDDYTGPEYQQYRIKQPSSIIARFAFNNDSTNPLVSNVDFRNAMYYAIDRDTFTNEVKLSIVPLLGFVNNTYIGVHGSNDIYRNSMYSKNIIDKYSPDTSGYDAEKAKDLFDKAYDQLVTDGVINEGDVVTLELSFYDIETGWKTESWFESRLEAIFNEGESSAIFDFQLKGLSGDALKFAKENGNFEMTYSVWACSNCTGTELIGEVYNSNNSDMIEKGFNTADVKIDIELPNIKQALEAFVNSPNVDTSKKQACDTLLSKFTDNILSTTFDELYNYTKNEFSYINQSFEGKQQEYDLITASLENVLFDQMISIPLYSTVNTDIHSERLVIEANEYNHFISQYDFRYMYIKKTGE